MSDARALALANSHKSWARRWLRFNSSSFLPASPKAIERAAAKRAARFIKGARSTPSGGADASKP